MFKKIAMFTDLHLGAKGNSKVHNQDCEDFINWFIDNAKKHQCDTIVFGGDFHHNRNNINMCTLDYSVRVLEKISSNFEHFFMILGNHDLYYKDRRDIHSIRFANFINDITVVNDILIYDKVALVPWLIGDEWKQVKKIKSPIVIGHFELPNFLVNANLKMPDSGQLNSQHFKHQKYVFSGHFHKRQQNGIVHYIGNAFPHSFSDNWDDERGMMILDIENDQEPLYLNWKDCPKYRTVLLSELLNNTESIIDNKVTLKVTLDMPISYEEASYIKETFIEQYKCRDISLIQKNQTEDVDSTLNIEQLGTVDDIVSEELQNINSEHFNKHVLMEIYSQL